MSANILELEGTVHQRVQKLLPWAVLGRLPETDMRLVQEHSAACADCRDDLAWQQRLQAVQPAAGAVPDMDAALARLLPQLETRPKAANGAWMRWALAAQVLLIAGLGAKVLMPAEPAYRLLGAGAGAAQANMVVVFRPETSEGRLRAILQAQGASVVGGPTAAKAWLLNVPASQVRGALAALRSDQAVEMAEPLQAAQ
jgi:hypothetical protein